MSNFKKRIITLVGQKQARVGFSFINGEPLKECEGCTLFKVCVANLDVGRVYSVNAVRDKTFPCKIHEEGVQVVEVIEPDIKVNIESRIAFPCGTITFKREKCSKSSCPEYDKCLPQGLKNGDKCKVLEVRGHLNCPLGYRKVSAILQLVSEQV